MTTTTAIPVADAPLPLIPIIERGPAADRGYAESISVSRGIGLGLAVMAPFWATVGTVLFFVLR